MTLGDPRDRTAVYRLYDAAGQLLYVGMSRRPNARLEQHRFAFPAAVRSTVEWFTSRPAAMNAERTAIRTENPLHNVERYSSGRPTRSTGRVIRWADVRYEIVGRWRSGASSLPEALQHLGATGLDPYAAGKLLPGVTVRSGTRYRVNTVDAVVLLNPHLLNGLSQPRMA